MQTDKNMLRATGLVSSSALRQFRNVSESTWTFRSIPLSNLQTRCRLVGVSSGAMFFAEGAGAVEMLFGVIHRTFSFFPHGRMDRLISRRMRSVAAIAIGNLEGQK
jgi:hypothetical protein